MTQRNIFDAGAVEISQLFGDYMEGAVQTGSCIALGLSERPLGASARTAIENSLNALGLTDDGCTYATLFPANPEIEGAEIALDPQSLFLLIEGLDPLCLIAADEASSALLARAYRMTLSPESALRVFGRPTVAFNDLTSLLETDAGKQKAWALFKTLA